MNQNQTHPHPADKRGIWLAGGLCAGLALGAVLMWWALTVYQDRSVTRAVDHLSEQLLQVQAERDDLYAHRDVLKGELAVESGTRKGLEIALETAQDELGAARDQIAFFDELMPPGPEGSISIRGLDFQQKGSMLQFRVLLMRHGSNTENFDGMLQFQASGRAAGDPVTIILEPVRVMTPDSATNAVEEEAPSSPALELSFEQFQRSSGLLQIPEGVELEEVTVNVLEGQTLRVSRTVPVPVQPLPH